MGSTAFADRTVTSTAAGPDSPVAEPVANSTGEVLRVEKLSYRDFVHDFQRKRRAVIFTDATADWAARGWTPEELKQRAGHRDLEIRTESGPKTWRFEELCEVIAASTPQRPAPYARN
jgi:hypothetical protein